MRVEELGERWHQLSAEVLSGMAEWRAQHPKATLAEIEAAVDERLGRLRRQMLEDAALVSTAAEWETGSETQPVCPACGTALSKRGLAVRELTTQYEQTIELKRRYGVCPTCQTGFFPPG